MYFYGWQSVCTYVVRTWKVLFLLYSQIALVSSDKPIYMAGFLQSMSSVSIRVLAGFSQDSPPPSSSVLIKNSTAHGKDGLFSSTVPYYPTNLKH